MTLNSAFRRTPAVFAAILLGSALIGASACGIEAENADRGTATPDVLRTVNMGRIDRSRILFVHQSVGGNIVDGLRSLQSDDAGARLQIVDLRQASEPAGGGFFAHARLGQNGRPKGKTDAFVSALEDGLGERLDVAFQKYCFADINAATDVNDLFAYYRAAMERVRREYPRLKLVHVTAPLVRVQAGPKAVVKRLIGRMPDHYEDNIARERFNTLMRREYQGREPVFDLAALEASRPGEAPEAFKFQGAEIYELRPEYTADGAHLNASAEKRIAAELLALLDHVLNRKALDLPWYAAGRSSESAARNRVKSSAFRD